MPEQQLNTQIQHLHDLLEGQPVDDCTAASLRQVTSEIQLALARAEGELPAEAFNDQLEQEVIQFAEDHPALAQAVRQIMNTLNSMGV
ncbi:DUF4404 family protein [Endozoicomonadaceae bacterium StTr2]